MANKNAATFLCVLLVSLFFSSIRATNIVRRDLDQASQEDHAVKRDDPATTQLIQQHKEEVSVVKPTETAAAQPKVATADPLKLRVGATPGLKEVSGVKPTEPAAAQPKVATADELKHPVWATPGETVMGGSMMFASAISLTISIVVFLYWRKGPFVIVKVLIYLLALSAMKGTVKMVENGNSFKFPLFLTAVHFACGAILAFVLLLRNSMFNGVEFAKPSVQDFGTKFGPIAFAFAASVSMNNTALIYSTSAFVEIVGASAPVVTVLMTLVMQKPFDIKLLAPCVIVFIGCALTSNGEPHFSALGLILAAGSNLPRAFKTILQQLLLQQDANATAYSPIEVLGWTCLPSSMIMFTWSFFQEGTVPYHQIMGQGLLSQLTLAIFVSAVNACILNTAVLFVVKDLGAVGTQIVAQTKSMLVILGGMCVLKEKVSRMEFLGFILVMIGVYTYNDLESRLKSKREAEKPALVDRSMLQTIRGS